LPGDGILQIEELIENIHVINTHIQHSSDLMAAFKLFDRKGEGFIR
jgi:Ca2+-binding EF-hand superfamily protein